MKKITLCFMLACFAGFLSAQSVAVDSTFGLNGVLETNLWETSGNLYGNNITVLPDGKTLIAGWTAEQTVVAQRFNMDGILDTTFAEIELGLETYRLVGVGNQKNDRIYVVGSLPESPSHTIVVALDSTGNLDPNFGIHGKVSTGIVHGYYNNLLVQSDKKVISYGIEADPAGAGPMVITRLNTDGKFDSTFAQNGQAKHYLGSGYTVISSGLEQPDGKLLFGCMKAWDLLIVRLNQNGAIDSTFGVNGLLIDPMNGKSEAYGLAIQADGKILATGYTLPPYQAIVARYNIDGSRDTTFGNQGVHYFPEINEGVGIAVEPDGKILTANWISAASDSVALARLLPNGQRDISFGNNGVFKSSVTNTEPRTMVLFGNKATVSGKYEAPNFFKKLVLLRFLLDLNVGTLNPNAPADLTLWVYPNPIAEQFTLKFGLAQKEQVSILLFDMNGKQVQSFAQNQAFETGEHETTLSCSDLLPSGSYVLTLEVAGKKMSSIQIMKK